MWSFAMLFVHKCGMTMVGAWLARAVGGTQGSWRQRLREWCYDAADKKGEPRAQLEVTSCFGPLLSWILQWWSLEEKRLALALDASPLSDRFTVLCISVVYRGCAIPVAWKLLVAGRKGEWKPLWINLLEHLRERVPAEWTVIVMADRGLYARWLYEEIQSLGWHPFLRVNAGGKARPQGSKQFHWLSTFAPVPGYQWSGRVTCFTEASTRLRCTLLARWDEGHAEAWLVVTDLEPEQAQVAWYAMRFWIECGFKDNKRGGWQWHQTKMQRPERAERYWLVLVVATLWVVSVGGQIEASLPASSLDELPATHIARRLAKQERRRQRRLSCVSQGLVALSVAVVNGQPVLFGQFVPFDWPTDVTYHTSQASRGAHP
jgi:hypothetical protein